MTRPAGWLLLAAGLATPGLAAAAKFECPELSGIFADPEQCDKYWVCHAGSGQGPYLGPFTLKTLLLRL